MTNFVVVTGIEARTPRNKKLAAAIAEVRAACKSTDCKVVMAAVDGKVMVSTTGSVKTAIRVLGAKLPNFVVREITR